MMKNKRGWITILEATIAVLLVSGVLIVVYSRQGAEDTSVQDYVFSLQKQILMDIASRSDFRTYVLSGEGEDLAELDEFVGGRIPPAYGYSLEICLLSDSSDNCKLNTGDVIATRGKELFAEEIIISAEPNPNNLEGSFYKPKKVRLFVWEMRGD